MLKYLKLSATSVAVLLAIGCTDSPSAVSQAPEAQKQVSTVAATAKKQDEKQTSYPTEVFFGDTHNHTGNSFDVYLFGTPSSTPDTAYRFAKGEKVKNPATNTDWQLKTPLDFLVVADHAELLGAMPRVYADEKVLSETTSGKALRKLGGSQSEDELIDVYSALVLASSDMENEANLSAKDIFLDLHAGDKRKGAWENYIDVTEKHNEPGKFTTLIGWEWTSNTGGSNLHRVVFMSDDGETARKFQPFSSLESDDPEGLWKFLDKTSAELDADFVAIPHNPNLSLGRMFPLLRNNGEPIDAEYARKRSQWEPVVEVTQIKGDSETHPALSPNDDFADFETFSFALTPDGRIAEPNKSDYMRSGLKRGLEFKQKLGVNPYKFGVIGSTDTHTGITAVEEDNFAGKGQHDNKPEVRAKHTGIGSSKGWDMSSAGYAAVWAQENTRESLVDAFKRKEVYTTTGPRISLRFFGGFDFTADDANSADLAAVGYGKGIPMGGDLPASNGKAPSFLMSVMKDPKGANLDRVQVVKGWVDAEGNSHEKVFDVAASDNRVITKGKVSGPVGSTVNLETGEYTNDIGAAQLTVVWTDPDFDATQEAFYYVRSLEIPTPRYSLLDAIKLGIKWEDTEHPATIQERVYSSPIWYAPKT
ncbi:DUF3604 domain-containing protein [Thalassotalea sp. PLHSN55]|uniref:DUF3604 domain-containing protein n=1 Tax=Thalassotalea sp. PLHSN55 TaxID=3435888 RepID=UPI003F86E232